MEHICFSYCSGKGLGAIGNLFPVWVQVYCWTDSGFRWRIWSGYHLPCDRIRYDDKCNHFCISRPEIQNLLGIKIYQAQTEILSKKSTYCEHLEKIRRNRNCLLYTSSANPNWWYFNHGFFRCEKKKDFYFNVIKRYILVNCI